MSSTSNIKSLRAALTTLLLTTLAFSATPALAQDDAAAAPAVDETTTLVVDEPALPAAPPEERQASDLPDWVQALADLDFYGSFRVRHESDLARDAIEDSHTEKLQVIIGTRYQVTDSVMVDVSISTGSADDPQSRNVTLGGGFTDFEVSFDRANVTYKPSWADDVWLRLGKFDNPFNRNPVYGKLVWDSDVGAEGALVGWSQAGDGMLSDLSVTVGEYILADVGQTEDALVTVLELKLGLNPMNDLSVTFSSAYYHWEDVTPEGTNTVFAGNATAFSNQAGGANGNDGNQIDNGGFRSQFGVFHNILAITYTGLDFPVTLAGEYVRNLRANGSKQQAWSMGFSVGEAKKAWEWSVYYQYQTVQQEAVFSPVAQDDFFFSTNLRGHTFGAKYKLHEQITLHPHIYVSEPENRAAAAAALGVVGTATDNSQWRARFDIIIKL